MTGGPHRVVVYADGGSRGNPGPAGYGAVVLDTDDRVLAERAAGLGHTTNNIAEYSGLVAALQAAADLGAAVVEVRMDSKLVVEQMSGRWKIKHPDLQVLARSARNLLAEFEAVSFDWVPRAKNKLADALANAAMDAQADGRTWQPSDAADLMDELASQDPPAPAATPPTDGPDEEATDPAAGPVIDPDGATTLIVVRHGQTTWGADNRFAGREDVPLTARGIAEARSVADRCAPLGVGAVLTSPLGRCRRTAEIIAAATSVAADEVQPAEELVDGALGDWTGLTAAQIAERSPAEFASWRSDPEAAPPGGETFEDIRARVRSGIRRILEEQRGRTVVLVTHAAVAKMIVVTALGAPASLAYRTRIDNCSISRITVGADGSTALVSLNDTGHLPSR
ncbi:MAG: bifunctional RNase H/acid phosphatase [Nakamurella sp.]